MSKKLRELLEIELAALRVEFEHACLLGNGFKAKQIIKQLNEMLSSPFKLPDWSQNEIPNRKEVSK